jgi:hypothetical protein
MLRDVFYYGAKPNVHPREQFAESLEAARQKCTTDSFWIINEVSDYRNFDWDFDFEFLPDEDVWAESHNNVWPSQHQKDSGTWLCPKEHSDIIIYRGDVDPVVRRNIKNDNWVELDLIDHSKFDFSWHPDPTDPPYIYKWGCKYFPAQFKHVLEYRVSGATQEKYIDNIVELLPEWDRWQIPKNIDENKFDFAWRPDPMDPPLIHEFGTQWQRTGGPIYTADDATAVKYTAEQKAVALPCRDNWEILEEIDESKFDFSWHPDNTAPAFIYAWGNQWNEPADKISVRFVMPGATDYQYMTDRTTKLADRSKWLIPDDIDDTSFDYSWEPSAGAPPYIYEFATQWQKTGGPQYVVEGATEKTYVDFQKVIKLPSNENWTVPGNIDPNGFDFSWHPDSTSPPYVYVFATQWAFSGGPVYSVPGATENKYVEDQVATAVSDKTNWIFNDNEIDVDSFDFSWHPYVEDQPYIYQFGTQWQKTGGPRYVTPGASADSPVKYIDTRILKAQRLPNKNMGYWDPLYDIQDFDYSWHPDSTEEPYVYVFGNQWYSAEVMPTVEYALPGAKEIKYVNDIVATLSVDMTNWVVPDNLDESSFDFSWRPEPESPKFIYEFATQWQKTGGPRYVMPGATDINYVDTQKAKRLPSRTNWTTPTYINDAEFDYSWHPDETAPPYVYVFATQWAFSGGPTYTVPGATEIKYVEDQNAVAVKDMTNWVYDPELIDEDSFDFSWHPYVEDQPYIYQFGTQWWPTGGPKYIAPGANINSPIKYIDTRIIKAIIKPNYNNWETLDSVDKSKFDFSWVPHPDDPPYIYVFGNQWFEAERMPTVKYNVVGATEIKYVSDIIATLKPNKENWVIAPNIVIKDFDFSWIPDPHSPPYIYVFGNQWYPSDEMPTVEYHVPGATERSYIRDITVTLGKNMTNWEIPKGVDTTKFDFSWIPHPKAPPYIYQFGTLQDPSDGPMYTTPNTNGETIRVPRVELENVEETTITINRYYIETTLEDLVNQHLNEVFWALNKDIDYTTFDFDWLPNIEQAQYVHVFGSASSEATQTYFVNGPQWAKGNRDLNWVQNIELTDETLADIFIKPDVFFVDRNNPESAARFEALKAKFGNKIQKTRYLNSWVDTISRCTNRATSNLIWVLSSELDYSDFDFDYYPNPWQMKMVHVFGTQWSHWGTTFMVNRETFREDTKYINIIEHLSNLNFVKERRAKATACVHDIVMIDHGNKEVSKVTEQVEQRSNRTLLTTIKYDDSYLNTLRNYIKKLPERKEHCLWICSSVCDYSQFDFTYVCDPFAKDNLHVFPSGTQKFGDTFFIDVNKTKEIIDDMEKLEEYHKVNFNNAVKTTRLPEPIIVTRDDTHVNAINKVTGFPYATIITIDNTGVEEVSVEPMNLWAPDTKNILITSTGATRIIVPAEAAGIVKKELYDYPYIKRAPKLAKSSPMDIVFLSNGETGADENWEHLLNVTKGLPNRVVRVDGVNGRAAAYHAAANASETPWMFTVFAKLKVSPKFDWNWQPDRMQVPKHYIFHAKNPVNGLTYGHQAMIAYNKKLTLANEGRGLDFTLDDEHETVPLISGTAMYNTDPFSTWRTAFREVLKLKADDSEESRVRIDAWLNKADGDFAQFSIKGAVDADEYYDEVDGDFDALKLSYEWAWLRDRFDNM